MNGFSISRKITGILILACSALLAQSSFDLRFLLVENQGLTGGNFDVKFQIKSNGADFGLGSSNLVFTYNTAGLSNPVLLEAHNFNGVFYSPISISQPAVGRVSNNIELFAPLNGITVPDSFLDVVTIRFTIQNTSASSMLEWRTGSPNPTIVFADDETTAIPPNNLAGLDIILPITPPETADELAREFILFQNYPNPFNPVTHIKFSLPQAGEVMMEVINLRGELVKTLLNGPVSAGYHVVDFDGRSLASGLYFYRIRAGDFMEVKKMALLK